MDRWINKIILGVSEDVLKEMPDNCIDSIVTDPPYGLKFMGKKWDYDVPSVALWKEAYRVLKPGAHVLSFGGTRTYHRMVVNIEDAGFEIRDQILWIYGSGFPKSLDVSKAIDKAAGEYVPGDVLPSSRATGKSVSGIATAFRLKTAANPQSDLSRQWQGWGTALKPAVEPICLARKPLEGTVANNVLKWGTGGMNIDECRVEGESTRRNNRAEMGYHGGNLAGEYQTGSDAGRFPANVIHDGSDEVLEHFPETSSGAKHGEASEGSAARFFYCAKASTSERGDGNNHPTVKPLDLIKYLVKLITPPDGIVLDMFGGSGTTALACLDLGFPYIVIEKEPDHVFIANERIKQATRQERLFVGGQNFFAPKRTPDAPKTGKVADSADDKSIAYWPDRIYDNASGWKHKGQQTEIRGRVQSNAPYPHPTERNGLNQEGNEGRTRDCRREEGSLTKNPAGGERG